MAHILEANTGLTLAHSTTASRAFARPSSQPHLLLQEPSSSDLLQQKLPILANLCLPPLSKSSGVSVSFTLFHWL